MMNPTHHMRLRFAPSPTGNLHVGSARTALMNWLVARKEDGTFIVRIEDTDRERSRREYEADIFAELTWLGLSWDEGPDIGGPYGPYRQSERGTIYERHLSALFEAQAAYYCFCTKERLEAIRGSALTSGLSPVYDGHCREVGRDEAARRLAAGERAVIRIKTPATTVEFSDMIRGDMKFDTRLLGDFVIAKGAREPLYNFAATVDDHEMHITHVIRGEDHLSNTPKQIVMQRALGFSHPRYAHVPLLLNPDRSKMSKRFADTAVLEYREAGYFPDALVNFLALLGWHPKDDRELLTRDELAKEFSLERVQKGGAVFQTEKLDWMNAQYLKRMDDDTLLAALEVRGAVPKDVSRENARRVLRLVRDRMRTMNDFTEESSFAFRLPEYPPAILNWKGTLAHETLAHLRAVREAVAARHPDAFTEATLLEAVHPIAEARGRGAVLWPLRVALSGKEASPGPYEMMQALGKTETLRRLDYAIDTLARITNA